jgi:inorganic pyrophosphatase
MANLWHETPLGDDVPKKFNAVIEIPKGSHNKYEIDKKTGLIALDRANYSSHPYPFDYGFAPQTLWLDDDPLDVVVLSTFPLHPGVLARVRPVAIMEMIDGGYSDDKIIAVPVDDKRWEKVSDLKDINEHTLKEIEHFFETYKTLKGGEELREVKVNGYKNRAEAIKAIEKSVELYRQKFQLKFESQMKR